MAVEPPTFQLGLALLYWLAAFTSCCVMGLLVGFVASLASYGRNGPRVFRSTLARGFQDLVKVSWQRCQALASLTFKEATSRKAFLIGFLFILLFMFGGWFLSESNVEKPAMPYITFVMSAIYFLLNIMALLIACWGLPADIKARSLHTVVTKPVRRSEIVLGRMMGYSAVVLIVLAVTSIFGYFWIQRQVPERAKDQLIARVPVYGEIRFLSRSGQPAKSLTNVGDLWDYRTYVEGLTQARAIWEFDSLNVSELRKQGYVRLEQSFEAFRTFKGDVSDQVRYRITLLNPESGLRVPMPESYDVNEFSEDPEASVVIIPEELTYVESYDVDAEEKTVNLFDDVFDGNSLTVEIACIENEQYLGVARGDLFIRMPDRPFYVSYIKSIAGLGMMLILVVGLGTTASCFLKGPVSTFLTGSLIVLGNIFYEFVKDIYSQKVVQGRVLGGGMFESMYRLVTQMNMQSPLPDNVGTDIIKFLDERVFNLLFVVNAVIPNFTYFNTNQYTANGFDVPWMGALVPSFLITIGYLIPLIILGYFSLQLRELESK
ncbi:ABC-2 family transporter protein [Thalassoglobus neptunius]|uniref:ABC-2 family transporter protein n=1 Tax=Thalassoglobus neptunius TaxID=1938619 RepID=A0A5C5X545_9PLAN|nr:ABC transporter permease subunit [Thalassoglobus neptunius]TWT57335.1 ABC-2 family transporter protein [Thalassoglobus neptunius]